jgi:hypothetical protein
MREFLTTIAIAVVLLLAALGSAHYFTTQIGFTATEVEHETTNHSDSTAD